MVEKLFNTVIHEWSCLENENLLRMTLIDGKLDEIAVGNVDAPSYGFSVIGMDDLTEALKRCGYRIEKR